MAIQNDESWLFLAEWYDPVPQMKKQYLIKYFPLQNQAEMIDVKNRKLFLKKSPCPPELSAEDFFIGSQILLYSRDLKIIDYGDIITKNKLQNQVEDCLVIIPWTSYQSTFWGKIIHYLTNNGYSLIKVKSILFTPNIYNALSKLNSMNELINDNASNNNGNNTDSPYLILKLQKENGTADMKRTIDFLFNQYNYLLYANDNADEYAYLYSLFLNDTTTTNTSASLPASSVSATYDHCSCCIIKPHILKSKQVGMVIDDILNAGYEISAIQSLYFTKTQAEEFLEVYKGVIPEYHDHILQFTSGLCIALEIRSQDPVTSFRQCAGPWDVEMAKALRPESLRGKYGVDIIRNAVHCTDLLTDGVTEVEYCFKIMSS